MNTYFTQNNNITWYGKLLALCLMFTLFLPLLAQAFVTTTDFPLNATNMIPSASTSGTISLENQSDNTLDAQIEVTTSLVGDLSDNMTVSISGGTAYTDSLTNFYNAGQVLLGAVGGNSSIALTLTITLNDDAPQSLMGQSTNFDFCIGFAGSEVSCGTAFSTLTNNTGGGNSGTRVRQRSSALVLTPPGEVLGATDSTPQCNEYLQAYIRPNAVNNSVEVIKLQEFLRDLGGSPNINVTGFYDETTIAAVRAFQSTYKSSILAPWGISQPTGYVYFTTRKLVNEIYCSFTSLFPLTEAQLAEIARIRQSGNAWTPESAGVIISASLGGAVSTETVKGEVAGVSTSNGVSIENAAEINEAPAVPESNSEKPSFFSRVWNWLTGWF